MSIGSFFSNIGSGISSAWNSVTSTIENVASKIVSTVQDNASGIVQTISAVASGNTPGIVSSVSNLAVGVLSGKGDNYGKSETSSVPIQNIVETSNKVSVSSDKANRYNFVTKLIGSWG